MATAKLNIFGWGYVFLSTPPSRVATLTYDELLLIDGVSIHATLAGGDMGTQQRESLLLNVSIHATLAGGDKLQNLQG